MADSTDLIATDHGVFRVDASQARRARGRLMQVNRIRRGGNTVDCSVGAKPRVTMCGIHGLARH
ncbi:hypothetical protein WS87_29075 [Burkholderia sp. MSMB0856]|nr:hypothetical protein WS87_29075 [Burkholderia sp. MSMB0856]